MQDETSEIAPDELEASDSDGLAPEEFDALVSDVMDELPEEWGPLLDRITVVVDDEPQDDDVRGAHADDSELLGCVRGAGGPVRLLGGGLSGPAVAAPPEIALFQGPLQRASSGPEELRALIRETLVREIGRCLGLPDDEELDDESDDALDDDALDDEDS